MTCASTESITRWETFSFAGSDKNVTEREVDNQKTAGKGDFPKKKDVDAFRRTIRPKPSSHEWMKRWHSSKRRFRGTIRLPNSLIRGLANTDSWKLTMNEVPHSSSRETLFRSFINLMPPFNVFVLNGTHESAPFCEQFHQWDIEFLTPQIRLQSFLRLKRSWRVEILQFAMFMKYLTHFLFSIACPSLFTLTPEEGSALFKGYTEGLADLPKQFNDEPFAVTVNGALNMQRLPQIWVRLWYSSHWSLHYWKFSFLHMFRISQKILHCRELLTMPFSQSIASTSLASLTM